MRAVVLCRAVVLPHLPLGAVLGIFEIPAERELLVVDVAAVCLHLLFAARRKGDGTEIVAEVELHGMHLVTLCKIERDGALLFRRLPEGADVFVGDVLCILGRGRDGAGLLIGKEHPAGRFEGSVLHGVYPIAEALIAVKLVVLIESRLPEPEAAFEEMRARNARGGRVPERALSAEGAAVTCARNKAARVIGIGRVLRERIGPERRIGDIDAVAINVELGAGGGVLEIILPLVLGHPSALHVGAVQKYLFQDFLLFGRQRLHHVLFGQLGGGLFQHRGELVFEHFQGGARFGVEEVIFAEALVADDAMPALEKHGRLPLGAHGIFVELHAVDGGQIGTPPKEVHFSVVIEEEVGIPKGEAALDLFKLPFGEGLAAIEIADGIAFGGAEIEIFPVYAHVGRIIIEGKAL